MTRGKGGKEGKAEYLAGLDVGGRDLHVADHSVGETKGGFGGGG